MSGMRLVHAQHLTATCWCEAAYVRIPSSWVGTRTLSCRRRECRAPFDDEWTDAGERVPSKGERAPFKPQANCGTIEGYVWHLANDTAPCHPCRVAWGCS